MFDRDANEILDLAEYIEYSKEKEASYELANSKELDETINFEHYQKAQDLVLENKSLKLKILNLEGFKEFYEADTDQPRDSKLSFDDFKNFVLKNGDEATEK